MIQVLLVITQSPGLPLLDVYQTTAPAGMCREQDLSKTIDSKYDGLHGA